MRRYDGRPRILQACLTVSGNSRRCPLRALSVCLTGGKLQTSKAIGGEPNVQLAGQSDPKTCLPVRALRAVVILLPPSQAILSSVSGSVPGQVPAPLAQLAEQLTLNQRVVGSSPTGGTLFPVRDGRVFLCRWGGCPASDARIFHQSKLIV